MIDLKDVSRDYGGDERVVHAVSGVSLSVAEGEFLAITGPSGCGKSTLLHLLGSLDTPTDGEIWVDGAAVHEMDERARTRYRRDVVGMVFQFFHLMPTMTVAENIALPLLLRGDGRDGAMARALELADMVGAGERVGHFMHELSGGEMQRVAVARALAHEPKVLLADEPTGNLDSVNAERVLGVFREIHERRLATLVVVTHSDVVAEAASMRVGMRDGTIEALVGKRGEAGSD
ncbi:MAG: ABC transporter ATP-binding protein [Verrucomicrobiota bacterium]